jgi:lipoprotein-releasing system ATP-binding protein
MNNQQILQMLQVSKSYVTRVEKLDVLKTIDLEVDSGTTMIITGESGSGKSTLLNCIGGLDHVTEGEIYSAGYKVSHLGENQLTRYRNKVIGFIFQFHYLLKDFTALENVMLPAFMGGTAKEAAIQRGRQLLAEVKLDKRLDHYPSQLSGGERQRVAVARSLINDPEIILADEPTGNLDEANSRTVEDILFNLVRQHRKTLLLVTHHTRLQDRADRHCRLEEGGLREV